MSWWDPGATALIVPVREAERAIGELRRLYSPSGAAGVPAHVTLVAPFAAARELRGEQLADIREAVARFRRFPFTLARVGRFESAVYLGPEPAHPFTELADALRGRFPRHPPVGWSLPSGIIPHVTIASRQEPALLDEIAAAAQPRLPIEAIAAEVLLMERGSDFRFRTLATFAFDA